MNGRPSPYRLDYRLDGRDYWDVSDAAIRLTKQACTAGARVIEDRSLRMRFTRDVAYFAKRVVNEVEAGTKSAEQGWIELHFASHRLGKVSLDVATKLVGLAAGLGQIKSGINACIATRGVLCVSSGIPLLAHGLNNVYENGVNLYTGRSDAEGLVRKGYQALAKSAGASKEAGNIAYASVDISLSAYSMFKMTLSPGAWHLFRPIPADYLRAYQLMTKNAVRIEMGANGVSIIQITDELEK